ncbi:ribonuclease III domain-containing protein [Powellomyces hirtus]|nr:ribonuclease III domain-containing protein [Powellomyces hirtus]
MASRTPSLCAPLLRRTRCGGPFPSLHYLRAVHTSPLPHQLQQSPIALSSPTATTPSPSPPSTTTTTVRHPHETARLAAFTARTGFAFSSPEVLKQALTHRSYGPGKDASARFEYLGERVLDLYVTEHLSLKYPDMPARALASVVRAYVGDNAVQKVSVQFGVPLVMRWKGSHTTAQVEGQKAVGASVLRSLLGALYVDQGAAATRRFIHAHFLSRTIDDLSAHLSLTNPMPTLVRLTQRLDKIRPVSRLLQETGRLSSEPVFLVGIYSGLEKIGEGAGSSKSAAEHSAAVNALCKYYFREVKDFALPSDSI